MMSFSRPIQWYRYQSHTDPIWPDAIFKAGYTNQFLNEDQCEPVSCEASPSLSRMTSLSGLRTIFRFQTVFGLMRPTMTSFSPRS